MPTFRSLKVGKIFGKFALRRTIGNEKNLDKNVPTSEQFKVSDVEIDLDMEKERWIALIEEYANYHNPDFVHDFFGKMSKDEIGILVYKHTDHHLRQFEV